MNIGQLIKLERQRQNMKQEYLASGICVPSYLSRIENGLVIPSEDIQQHLVKRLNIPVDALNSNGNEVKLSQFKSQFKSVINSRDKLKAKSLYQDLHVYIEEHPFEPNRLTLLVMETRLTLMLPNYTSEVQTNLAILEEFKKEMTTEQLFYLSTIQGIIAYQNNEFRQATEIFMQVFSLIKSYRMEDWEMAELYYISSLSLLSESRYILAIDYVKVALSYFNQEILIERSIECLVILGIAQKNTGVLKDAVATYEKAMEISSKIESSKFIGMIEHNLGACHSLLKNQKQALNHFQNSLSVKSSPNDSIITIFSIIKSYYKISDFVNAKVWLNKGLELLDSLNENNKLLYTHHLSIFKAILFEEKDLIATFKEALDYFESKQEYKHCSIYSNVLAKKLSSDKQYKQSTIYYEQGFNYHIKQLKVSNWEELL
ncbi:MULTISPECIES: helix-turn-helix transcriptional regulator [unclassified Psychrobacillus]|uniref:helix-turn-helix domain-containing protein n=1 Tax=unclassified Psychrobacillus TaxID=2636677 RepID=UPI00146E91F8|nr:helix-turn-helix transcriptional regulator [Psychrobacillus sp. MER TA 171]NME04757.1 helix-turn-helix transcriptional regulator [Psychrobacillus sp. BL-248-WT-3]